MIQSRIALKRLSHLISARLTIREALRVLGSESPRTPFENLYELYEPGLSLSDLLNRQNLLSSGALAILQKGEEQGRIEESLLEASAYEQSFDPYLSYTPPKKTFRLPKTLVQALRDSKPRLLGLRPSLDPHTLRLIHALAKAGWSTETISYLPQTGFEFVPDPAELWPRLAKIRPGSILFLRYPHLPGLSPTLEFLLQNQAHLALQDHLLATLSQQPCLYLGLEGQKLMAWHPEKKELRDGKTPDSDTPVHPA